MLPPKVGLNDDKGIEDVATERQVPQTFRNSNNNQSNSYDQYVDESHPVLIRSPVSSKYHKHQKKKTHGQLHTGPGRLSRLVQ